MTVRRRVVIVEDHPIFLDALGRCLDAEPDFEVVARFTSGLVDVGALVPLRPEIMLMDIQLPGRSGIDVTREARALLPGVRVIMLTAYGDADLLFQAMQAGAVGYVLKHTPAVELVSAMRRIAAGEHVLDADLASRFLREFAARAARGRDPRFAALTPREEQVLKLLATGDTNRQIARRLFVSEETIKSHVAAIFRKLDVADRTGAAVLAVKAGLVEA